MNDFIVQTRMEHMSLNLFSSSFGLDFKSISPSGLSVFDVVNDHIADRDAAFLCRSEGHGRDRYVCQREIRQHAHVHYREWYCVT